MLSIGLGVASAFDTDTSLAPKPGSEPRGDRTVQEELAREGSFVI